jgi:hypothetical protein
LERGEGDCGACEGGEEDGVCVCPGCVVD